LSFSAEILHQETIARNVQNVFVLDFDFICCPFHRSLWRTKWIFKCALVYL